MLYITGVWFKSGEVCVVLYILELPLHPANSTLHCWESIQKGVLWTGTGKEIPSIWLSTFNILVSEMLLKYVLVLKYASIDKYQVFLMSVWIFFIPLYVKHTSTRYFNFYSNSSSAMVKLARKHPKKTMCTIVIRSQFRCKKYGITVSTLKSQCFRFYVYVHVSHLYILQKPCPETKSSILGRLTYWWINRYKKNDVWTMYYFL